MFTAPKELGVRLIKSFGAIYTIMSYFEPLEQLHLQVLCLWFYRVAVSRAQVNW